MPLLLNPARLPLPASTTTVFDRSGPLVLELGFGDGRFLQTLARQHPDWNLLGADTARVSVTRAWHRMRGLSNVRLYCGSGVFLLSNLVRPESLHCMYVNFPDPWPKARHAHRRLFQPGFLRLLAARLAAGGALLLTTDDHRYFAEAIARAQDSGLFAVAQPDPPAIVLQTRYARKWRGLGRTFRHATLRKCAGPAEPVLPTVSLVPDMFHALLAGDLPEPAAFTPNAYPFKGGKVVLLQSLRTEDGRKMVVLARTHEEELIQDLLIEVRPTKAAQADLVVNLTPFGQPLATHGAREAVKAVTGWLINRGLTLVDTYY
ncbi:MAG: tRNA (guanine-N7)-methyltransferase [Bacteroidota bacterium]|nr:tRNA (guanine-N7)-methyltransferase [Bacteroidota bacterium]